MLGAGRAIQTWQIQPSTVIVGTALDAEFAAHRCAFEVLPAVHFQILGWRLLQGCFVMDEGFAGVILGGHRQRLGNGSLSIGLSRMVEPCKLLRVPAKKAHGMLGRRLGTSGRRRGYRSAPWPGADAGSVWNHLKLVQPGELTMSSKEIADLVESRHDNVMTSVDRLAARGVVRVPATQYVEKINNLGFKVKEKAYLLVKRDSLIVVAQLCPEFTARIVDRWQELEEEKAGGGFNLPDFSNSAIAA